MILAAYFQWPGRYSPEPSRISCHALEEESSSEPPQDIGPEKLEQRTLVTASHFRPRVGKSRPTPKLPWLSGEASRKYSVGPLKALENQPVELCEVVVDGRKIREAPAARHALLLASSQDDRLRKRMLRSLARHAARR